MLQEGSPGVPTEPGGGDGNETVRVNGQGLPVLQRVAESLLRFPTQVKAHDTGMVTLCIIGMAFERCSIKNVEKSLKSFAK